MSQLDDLLNIDCIIVAGEFAVYGGASNYKTKMEMPPDMDRDTSQFDGLVSMLFNTLAGAFLCLP